MVVRPRAYVRKTLRLAYWKADSVYSNKLELEQFLSEHGVNIFLLNETHLESERALRFAIYVCHWTDRPTWEGGIAILVCRGIDHYAVPVLGLQYLEATAIHLELATRQVVRGGLPLAQKILDLVGPHRVSERRIPRLDSGRTQREARGLEF
jgi:hypothetical protein